MPLHINGHFVDSTFLFLFLFSAIADLLDNAVNETRRCSRVPLASLWIRCMMNYLSLKDSPRVLMASNHL
ncbi:unnamed protein product [Prunus armeniaca]